MAVNTQSDSSTAKINNRREDLADLADSDLPCNQLAEALLEVAESEK